MANPRLIFVKLAVAYVAMTNTVNVSRRLAVGGRIRRRSRHVLPRTLHDFIPDFIVGLHEVARDDAEHVVIEVKGLEREAHRSVALREAS